MSQILSSVSRPLLESDIAKFVANLYLETSVSTLDITLSTSIPRRRSGTSSFMETCVYINLL